MDRNNQNYTNTLKYVEYLQVSLSEMTNNVEPLTILFFFLFLSMHPFTDCGPQLRRSEALLQVIGYLVTDFLIPSAATTILLQQWSHCLEGGFKRSFKMIGGLDCNTIFL